MPPKNSTPNRFPVIPDNINRQQSLNQARKQGEVVYTAVQEKRAYIHVLQSDNKRVYRVVCYKGKKLSMAKGKPQQTGYD
jgi:hypothetical protein